MQDLKYKDKVLVLGHGPSLNRILDDLPEYHKDYDLMSLNDWYNVHNHVLDFVVCTSPFSEIYPTFFDNIKKETVYFFRKEVEAAVNKKNLDIKCVYYKWKHDGFDLLRAFKEKTGREVTIGCSTIVINLILSVLMGYREIYFIGVELDSRVRYAGNKNKNKIWKGKVQTWEGLTNQMDFYRSRIADDIQVIKNAAGVPVIDLTFTPKDKIRKIL